MDKIKIKLVKLGKQRHEAVYHSLEKYQSDLFTVELYEKSLPPCDYRWGYSFQVLTELLSDDFDGTKHDMCIGCIDTEIENNYFGKRLKDNNLYVISFYQVDEIVSEAHLDVFNYLLSTIYRYLTRYCLSGQYLTHDETKGCLFDMCGNKADIVFSCSSPIICDSCMVRMKKKGISSQYIKSLQKEIKRIKKSNYYRLSDFIKAHPYIALLIGGMYSLIIGLLSCLIYDLIKQLVL